MKLSALIKCLVFVIYFLFHGVISAQTIESLQWVDGSEKPTARINFNANVRFLRQAPATTSDLIQVSFQIITADEIILNQTVEESKRLAAYNTAPELNLNYAPSSGSRTKQLSLRLARSRSVIIRQGPGAKAIDIIFLDGTDLNNSEQKSTLPPMAEAQGDKNFAVLLLSVAQGQVLDIPRVTSELREYELFTQKQTIASETRNFAALGYFRTKEDAEIIRLRLLGRFPSASILELAAVSVASTTSPSDTLQSKNAVTSDDLPPADAAAIAARDRQASDLNVQAKNALDQKRFLDATEILNRALLLPPNPSSELSQEMIGKAWEGLGQLEKAKLEYKLYLAQYPQGSGSKAVAERLMALGGGITSSGTTAATNTQVLTRTEQAAKQQGFNYSGSVSQYYYGGKSKSQSLINISAGIDQNTLTRTNQSALVTSLDLSGRINTENSETKLVLRDTISKNFIAASNAQSILSAAYVDYRNLNNKLSLRVGRQSAIGGSLFGLFDGVSMALPVAKNFKLDAMVGVPANTLVSAPSQRLMGVMLEADNLYDHWGGNVSFIDQKTDGVTDRQSMGVDIRYFGENLSMYSQIDYSLNFRTVNAFTLQGSLQGPADSTITILADNRRSPSLQLTDALISSGTTSLKTLLQLKTIDEIKDLARGTSAQAKQMLVSISRAISPKWQGSADIRYSDIGALPAVGNFQAQAATGAQYNFSVQLTGSNLYSKRDVNGFNISQLTSPTLKGTQMAFNNLTGLWGNKASLEPSIRFYTQTDNASTKVFRLSPGVRLSYKISDRASVLGESIVERSKTDGPSNHDASTSIFFYVGYRYDLF